MDNFRTEYTTKVEGAISSARINDTITGIASVDGIQAGRILVHDYANGDKNHALPTAASTDLDISYPVYLQQKYVINSMSGDGISKYSMDDPLPMLVKGTIWVKCLSGCNAGEDVYVRHDGLNAGLVDNVSSANTITNPAPQYKFLESVAPGELAEIYVNK